MKYLCLDPGLKHTGIAVSYEGVIAQPLTTIEADSIDQLVKSFTALLKQEQPDRVIIGQPQSGPLYQFSLELQSRLVSFSPVEITLFPEDLSSREAVRRMIDSGAPKKRRQSASHQSAAAVILQEYLDTH